MYSFSVLQLRAELLILNMNDFSSFSSNLFVILVYYLEVGDVGCGIVAENIVLVNLTGDMTVVFFILFSKCLLDCLM